MTESAPLEVTKFLSIPRSELDVSFARSGGPGGQNVNKVSSKVVLRFSVRGSPSLTEEQRARILEKAPPRYLTADGDLVIAASEHRDQPRNREAAETRLVATIRDALVRPKVRRATRPGRGARARRRDSKERQSDKKRGRRELD
jgi:ribosome-associated protein